ncbi:MAG TPA: bifunctional 2-polyprenyl-6-hydroxyphenol methylase/3-demethylubiquinol 3-O-methyltransferase UbiG [Elainellaceae cyanobacterium]|jgi:2-polyprenyl-6-hydroxyphenyl methylase/3-demethylubiquinone-9 3-methyltransferase
MLRNDLTFYDAQADQWWEQGAKIYALNQLNPLRFQYFDRHVKHWQGLQVLDVGCGGGFTCEFLAARGAIVSGIDQSAPCIASATAHARRSNLAIAYQHGYSEALPYPDQRFDGVVCVDVLEHVANVPQTLREIERVLKPGGFFWFDTINRTLKSRIVMIGLLEYVLNEIPVGIHDWHKFIRPTDLINSLTRLGFTEIDISGFNLFGSTPWDMARAYWRYKKTGGFTLSLDRDTSVMYIGIARKLR